MKNLPREMREPRKAKTIVDARDPRSLISRHWWYIDKDRITIHNNLASSCYLTRKQLERALEVMNKYNT